ncbi:hypothetical protein GALMADRAFT_241511 [Galerina marginata CBS 339.88]|uniref:Yeast cell wall synthesis Kre9/Knh1-like N-terminal domain-containing protein n=1 Tax=Galerina marginata (strain CBS 339.88) TaxID=685588 RepID=A0A067TF62_GALM3|nr:hypothetical protein GALMADRAFT_241511 [Galerina marginata CBS 339.88]
MKFTSFTTFASLLVSAFSVISASPVADPTVLEKRDVFVPPVLYPHAGTVWTIGQRHNVTWDTSNHPVNITNKVGLIILRKAGLATPVILANKFDILLGRIEVTVPWVVDGSDYQIVLFGDSGNFSPEFTINGSGVDF